MKIVIVGGGASGLSCAARLRRLDGKAEIIVLEKSNESSIASCGLPYFIGEVIEDREVMQVAKPGFIKNVLRIDVRLNSEVCRVDFDAKNVELLNKEKISYDKLVLATGAGAIMPPFKGMPAFTVKSLVDADKVKDYIRENHPKSAVVIGGGFIGVEVAENLQLLGVKTILADAVNQILPPFDTDMVGRLEEALEQTGVTLCLGDKVKSLEEKEVVFESGKKVSADFVIVSLGVRPHKLTDLESLPNGALLTNEFMQTVYPDVYACGDGAAVSDFADGQKKMIALAGPANRQGRLIADHIMGKPYAYTGSQGTGIVKVGALTGAFTGLNEKQLQGKEYHKMIVWSKSHAGYYPNASFISLKVLYSSDGDILGAQAIGSEGVDKRIDVIATIMRLHGKTTDLRDAELCYAPPYGSAKDIINIMGMAIENVRQGLVRPYFGTDFTGKTVIDVRPEPMHKAGHLPNALSIPMPELIEKTKTFDKSTPIVLHCHTGYNSYVAFRLLSNEGFTNLWSYAGGWNQYRVEMLKNGD